MNKEELHPIGVMPNDIWIEHRIQDLSEAILRYINANLPVPYEWYEERNEHLEWLNARRKRRS